MTKSYKNLKTKLHELQSILDEALLLGPESHSHDSYKTLIKQKLGFIANLVSAEKAASHPSQPHNLHHITEWLSTLERNFKDWDSCRSVLPGHDSSKGSTCSYTDSCVYDDRKGLDETGLVIFQEPEKVSGDSNCKKGMVEYSGAVAEASDCVEEEEEEETGEMKNEFDKLTCSDYEEAEDFCEEFAGDKELVEFEGDLLKKSEEEGNNLKREERREGNSTFGERCGALAGGVVIGMILMAIIMLNTCDCFDYVEEPSFSVPT